MATNDGLITAVILDGKGGGRTVGWSEVAAWRPEQGILWMHLDYSAEAAHDWLLHHSGLDENSSAALLAEETRPRAALLADGLLLILRGVNLNPGADPEDMVSLRLWSNGERIISTRRRRLLSIDDLRQDIAAGRGPRSAAEFVVQLANRMVARMVDVIDGIEERVDGIEERVLTAQAHELRGTIAHLRREAIIIRRYLSPQREAILALSAQMLDWVHDVERLRLREVADRVTRYLEELDATRERAAVVQEELISALSEQMDKRMYLLSLVAAVFLPLGFLTGLLGINVGGIPGTDYGGAFVIVLIIVVLVGALEMWYFRIKRWL